MNESRRRMRGERQRGIALIATTLFLILAVGNSARADENLHEIVWGHRAPDSIQAFVLYVGPQAGDVSRARRIDVGKPNGESIGFLQLYSAIVSMAPEEFVAVAAIGLNGLTSPLSAWTQAKPGQPGQPIVIER